MKLERIKVGKITSPVGIKGEVKVYPYTDYLERFEELEELQADGDIVRIEKVRYKNEMVILKFEGIDDRNAAEVMRNKFLTIGKDELRELDEDKYYIFDLIGLEAVDQEGHHLGTNSKTRRGENVERKISERIDTVVRRILRMGGDGKHNDEYRTENGACVL